MNFSKMTAAALLTFSAFQAFSMPHDYAFSFYGKKARMYFQLMTKNTPDCAYMENRAGETERIYLVIAGQKINSILCRQVGEKTFACEASTLQNSEGCN